MDGKNARFGDVRSWLSRGPGEHVFAAVCALWPDGDVPEEVIVYVRGAVSRWPLEVPCAVPAAWRARVERGEPCAAVAMCRTLRVHLDEVEEAWWRAWSGDRVTHHLTHLEVLASGAPWGSTPRASMPPPELWSSALARGLRAIRLCGMRCEHAGMMALAGAPCMSHLRSLAFEGCEISLEVGQSFLRMASHAPLRELVLREMMQTPGHTMGDELGTAWVKSGLMSHVERLDLSGNALTMYTVEQMCASRAAAQVRDLDLSGNSVTRHLLGTLAASYWSSQLHTLRYRAQNLEHGVLDAFRRSPHLSRLHTLDLSHCDVNVEEVEALFGSAVMHRLRALDMSYCGLGDLGMYALASAGPFSRTERLNLCANEISDEGASVLAAGVVCTSLRDLDVRENRVTEQGARMLLGAPLAHADLKVTWAGDTAYRDRVARVLAHHTMFMSRGSVHQIDELHERLKVARLAPSARALACSGAPEEVSLKVCPGDLSPHADVEWMATWPALRYLTHVDISGTDHGMPWIQAVLGSPGVQRVRSIDVRRSQVGQAFLSWLDAWPGREGLRTLALCEESPDQLRRVMRSAWFIHLERFVLECTPEMRARALEIWEDEGVAHVELVHIVPVLPEPEIDIMTRE